MEDERNNNLVTPVKPTSVKFASTTKPVNKKKEIKGKRLKSLSTKKYYDSEKLSATLSPTQSKDSSSKSKIYNYSTLQLDQSDYLSVKHQYKENSERIKTLKNRIKNLQMAKMQNEKKMDQLAYQEERNNYIKRAKNQLKEKLAKQKLKKEKELELKREQVKTAKMLNQQSRTHAEEQQKIRRQIIAETSRNDKTTIKAMVEEFKKHTHNSNTVKCVLNKNQKMYSNAKKMKTVAEKEEKNKLDKRVEYDREKRENEFMLRNIKELEKMEQIWMQKYTSTLQKKRETESKVNYSCRNNWSMEKESKKLFKQRRNRSLDMLNTKSVKNAEVSSEKINDNSIKVKKKKPARAFDKSMSIEKFMKKVDPNSSDVDLKKY